MTENLMLDSLEIKGFRGYKHLVIERLRRVNLIVGANGVGKSSLLEAVQLLIGKAVPELVLGVLDKRNEGSTILYLNKIASPDDSEITQNIRIAADSLSNLFYGRPDIASGLHHHEFSIGSLTNPEQTLKVKSGWFEETEIEEDYPADGQSLVLSRRVLVEVPADALFEADAQLGLTVQIGKQVRNYRLENYFQRSGLLYILGAPFNAIYVEGIDTNKLSSYWSNIVLTNYETNVLEAIRIISPDIEGFGFRDDERGKTKYPIVRLKDQPKPVPLHSLGEGAVRILGMILALVNSKDGVLLVDEIDTGLHHSVQIKMWEFIFRLSEKLNVQVFATTHSQDCLSAFEYVANQHVGLGQLISLGAWQDFINVTLVDEKEMKIALKNYVELRGTG